MNIDDLPARLISPRLQPRGEKGAERVAVARPGQTRDSAFSTSNTCAGSALDREGRSRPTHGMGEGAVAIAGGDVRDASSLATLNPGGQTNG